MPDADDAAPADDTWDLGDGPEDVGNAEEEEDFETGMRRNAQDYEAADADQDNKLDFDEFCGMVRQREEGDFTEEELRSRFNELDADGSGKVDMHEYLRFSLREALHRSSARVMDLFRQWDEDGSGEIDKKEFRRAIQALGFDFFDEVEEIDKVFEEFDLDGSGQLEYKELNKMLRAGQSVKLDKKLLAGGAGEIKMDSKNKHKLRKGKKGSGLQSSVKLKPQSGKSIVVQLQVTGTLSNRPEK